MKKNIISIENLNKAYSDKTVCDNLTCGIHENEKIALIGINGCGKSTFLKMLASVIEPDSGSIVFRSNTKVGYLPQVPVIDESLSIFDNIFQSDTKEFELLRRYYSANESEKHKLEAEINALGAFEIETNARRYLSKMGFADLDKKAVNLSGGEKRRLDLAKVLTFNPDVILLDEPTNHLDIDTIEWLQEMLINYKGILIFVTHDRYFLDAVSNKIMEIENGKVRFYNGNYSYYIQKKQDELIDLQRKETRKKAQLSKELTWLQRGAKARTSKPKNHIDRVKELLSKSYLSSEKELDISFKTQKLGKTILELKSISKSYGSKNLFDGFEHNFQKLERIGIVGANGCGKTTLLKAITDEIDLDSGKIKTGLNTKFAYFKQEQDDLNQNITVLDYIKQFAENIRTEDGTLFSASQMLEKFLFSPKLQRTKLTALSGGEKKRLYLLKSLMFGSNFIILDEPTNDLDIKTLEVLEDYLDAFKGCLLVVSHDRFFLDRVCDYLFIFEENGIRKFPGNYSDYLLVKRYKADEEKQTKQVRQKPKTVKKISWKEEQELKKLDTEIEELNAVISKLNKKMVDEATSLSYQQFDELTKKLKQTETELEIKEERWLELEEKKQ